MKEIKNSRRAISLTIIMTNVVILIVIYMGFLRNPVALTDFGLLLIGITIIERMVIMWFFDKVVKKSQTKTDLSAEEKMKIAKERFHKTGRAGE